MLNESFIFYLDSWVIGLTLFILMMLCIYGGRKFGLWIRSSRPNMEDTSSSTVSAILGLLAFILAFTFGMSGSRFDTRRKNIVEEANAIGTAVLRADLYPEEHKAALRKDFQQYVEARINYYEMKRDIDEVLKAKEMADDFGKRIWDRTAMLSQHTEYLVASQQMIPAVNEMLDVSTTRLIGELSRVPDTIIWMLFILSLSSAFYVGYVSAAKEFLDWFVATGFCLLTAVVVYITMDLDRPRRGLIQLDTPQKAMLELRKLF